jgi:hypothetical protein
MFVVETVEAESVEFTSAADVVRVDVVKVDAFSVEVFAVFATRVLKTAVLPAFKEEIVAVDKFPVAKTSVLPRILDPANVESVREGTVIVDAAKDDVTINVVVRVHAKSVDTFPFADTMEEPVRVEYPIAEL